MRGGYLLAAVGAAAIGAPGAAQSPEGWWYVGQAGQPPQRQLIFVDRSSARRQGDSAEARGMFVFEQPRGDVRSFAATYSFQCAEGRFQARDVLFLTTAGREEPEHGVVYDWRAATPHSAAGLVLDAACFGRFDSAARPIASAPMAAAAAIFRAMAEDERSRGGSGARPQTRAAQAPARPIECRGTIYYDGRAHRAFSAWLTIQPDAISMRFSSEDLNFTQRYTYARTATGDYRMPLPNGSMTYSPNRTSLTANYVMTSEVDDADPNNPFPVEVRERVEYRSTCTPE